MSHQVGGDSDLSAVGLKHAHALAQYLRTRTDWLQAGLEVTIAHFSIEML